MKRKSWDGLTSRLNAANGDLAALVQHLENRQASDAAEIERLEGASEELALALRLLEQAEKAYRYVQRIYDDDSPRCEAARQEMASAGDRARAVLARLGDAAEPAEAGKGARR